MYPQSLSTEERPWLGLYADGASAEVAPEHPDALSMFRACVAGRPEVQAIRYFDRTLSYREIDASSDALACALASLGVQAGDRVAVALQNMPEFVILCLAAWKLAAVPLPINPMYRSGELSKVFADAQPKAVLCEDLDAQEIFAGLTAAGEATCALILTCAKDTGLTFDFGGQAVAQPAPSHSLRLADMLDAHLGRKPGGVGPAADDLGLLLYTSGTTGVPKGAMIRHQSLASNAQVLRDWCGLHEASRIWALAPYFHITGFICHMLAAFSARATVVMHYRFDPRLALKVIRATRPTFTIGAITAFNALMNAADGRDDDFASFERIYSGGAPIPPTLADAFAERFGVPIYPSYGMTETTAPTHMTPFGVPAPLDPVMGALSIGVPVPSTEAAIIDDQGQAVPVGKIGEVVMRGPQIMTGYWRKPEESATTLVHGWMHSGDVGFMDEKGWFYLVDRKKDVIIASGFKVWPREVEDVLYTHPAVREAAVVGVQDAYRGETVKAYVSLAPGVECRPEELADYCRTQLAAYKAPRLVEILPELPKTVTGKIQRAALRTSGSDGPALIKQS